MANGRCFRVDEYTKLHTARLLDRLEFEQGPRYHSDAAYDLLDGEMPSSPMVCCRVTGIAAKIRGKHYIAPIAGRYGYLLRYTGGTEWCTCGSCDPVEETERMEVPFRPILRRV